MAIIDRLIAVYRLWREIHNHFPKKSRHTLGRKIDSAFIEILELAFTAGYLPKDKKLPFVQKAVARTDVLKFFLRIAWEVKDIDTKKYAALSEPLDDIGRMLGGWMRNVESRAQPPAR
ncbi:MAG: four helix bundle protein [Patescibacteria group bacterium]